MAPKPGFNPGVYSDWLRAARNKFRERSLNLRAIVAEFIGMTFFVFAGCGTAVDFSAQRVSSFASNAANATSGGANSTSGAIGSEALDQLQTNLLGSIKINSSFGVNTAFAFGMGIMVVIYCLGHISGGHFNPAVSLSLVLSGNCSFLQGAANVAAQVVGAILGASLVKGLAPGSSLGANSLSSGVGVGSALLGEIVMTAFLCFTVHMTACTRPNDVSPMAPLAIGFAVFLGHCVLIPVDGCSINPARSLGPAIISGTWKQFWIFVAGPFAGSAFGSAAWLAVAPQWDIKDVGAGNEGGIPPDMQQTTVVNREDGSPSSDKHRAKDVLV